MCRKTPCFSYGEAQRDKEPPELIGLKHEIIDRQKGVTFAFPAKDKPLAIRIAFSEHEMKYLLLEKESGLVFPKTIVKI